MENLQELKKQLNKGSFELKKKAYLNILNGYCNEEKVVSYMANKLVKLPSVNLFSNVMESKEAKCLPLMDIYMRRLVECKSDSARRDTLRFNAFPINSNTYKSTTPWRKGDEETLKSVFLNDSDMYVRQDAFKVFMNSFGKEYPTQSMYELAEKCISKPHDEGGVFLHTVYYFIPMLPYSELMYDFIYNKITHAPIDHEVGTLVTQFQINHPKEFLPLIPVIQKIINEYIEQQSPSLLKKLFGGNKSKHLGHDKNNISLLAHELLQACESNKEMLLYIQNVAHQLNDDELKKFVLVKLTYIHGYDFDYAEKQIFNVISDSNNSHYVRLFAIEKLKDFYKQRKVVSTKNTINKILKLFNTEDSSLQSEIVNTFNPTKDERIVSGEIETIPDEVSKVFFDAITEPLNIDEQDILWDAFLKIFNSKGNDINALMNCMIDAQSIIPYERKILFHLDIKDKDVVETQVDNSIRLLALPEDFIVYKKNSDHSLPVEKQLKLYASALKKHGFNILEIDMAWDDYLAIIIKDTVKTTIDDFLSDYIFYEKIKYL